MRAVGFGKEMNQLVFLRLDVIAIIPATGGPIRASNQIKKNIFQENSTKLSRCRL